MICNECSRRNCRIEPEYNTVTGRFKCIKHVEIKGGFPLLELAWEKDGGVTVYALLSEAKIKMNEMKRYPGWRLHGVGNNDKGTKRSRKKRGFRGSRAKTRHEVRKGS